MGRGGDQVPFLQKGYPAIRFSVGVEDYDHQHQDLGTEDGVVYGDTIDEMDFAYLAGVTQLNVRALDALARAPMPPKVTVDAAVRVDTLVQTVSVPGAIEYRLSVRRTDETDWRDELPAGNAGESISSGVISYPHSGSSTGGAKVDMVVPLRGDDWMFGVQACAVNYCSPVASAVPGGAFQPVPKE
jgi:hypothetical protein